MDCAPVRSIISSLKLGDYLSVQAHNPCSISHFNMHLLVIKIVITPQSNRFLFGILIGLRFASIALPRILSFICLIFRRLL